MMTPPLNMALMVMAMKRNDKEKAREFLTECRDAAEAAKDEVRTKYLTEVLTELEVAR